MLELAVGIGVLSLNVDDRGNRQFDDFFEQIPLSFQQGDLGSQVRILLLAGEGHRGDGGFIGQTNGRKSAANGRQRKTEDPGELHGDVLPWTSAAKVG